MSDQTFQIIHAGALHRVIGSCLELFAERYPGVRIKRVGAGSREGARRVLAGEHYDVIALADQALFAELLVPDVVQDYFVFATDQIVVGYDRFSPGSMEISADNWMDILLRPEVTFARSNQSLDPCGYRTLMVWQLAEKFYQRPGLYNQLAASCPGHFVFPKSLDLAGALLDGKVDYAFLYASEAKQLGFPYLPLPDRVNLSNPAFAEFYDRASVALEGKLPGQSVILHGKPIEFAVGITQSTVQTESARAFIELLTGPEGHTILEDCGLIPC